MYVHVKAPENTNQIPSLSCMGQEVCMCKALHCTSCNFTPSVISL